ncbi:ankyrin repeat-containing domain protein [Annulohypoxylon stygium]|nr:ankyrin repeat-containing domain protein [Annulohypoxylon stygium]
MIFSICCSNIRVTFAASSFRMDADDGFSQIDSIIETLCKNNLLHYSLSYLKSHLKHLGQHGLSLRREFMSFIRDIMATPLCYSALLLSRWYTLYWLPKRSIGISHTNAKSCLQSAFVYSAMNGREQALKILLILEADINAPDERHNWNALQAASYQGHIDIVKFLLKNWADINAEGLYGSALQAASYRGHTEVVRFLLKEGANVNVGGGLCGSALQAASYQGHFGIVRLLLDHRATVYEGKGPDLGSALPTVSYHGPSEIVRLLLEDGSDVNVEGGLYGRAV